MTEEMWLMLAGFSAIVAWLIAELDSHWPRFG